ncbi:hypothetical protein BUALT_Bualt03G0144000 [Buddleja alternifolia]|uniref:Transcription factor GTE4 n=1 Tax=Buddleja alternifolia TaxID=168488 RepID=A0AAV6XTP8_9LAMI|nr:hypothetical protein BUALT_Bualt03G0144000 [Buddleja alternifolia]
MNLNDDNDGIGGFSYERPIGVKKAKLKKKIGEQREKDSNMLNEELKEMMKNAKAERLQLIELQKQQLYEKQQRRLFRQQQAAVKQRNIDIAREDKILEKDLSSIDDPTGFEIIDWWVVTCMASGAIGDSSDDLNSRGRSPRAENYKVYTRRTHKKAPKPSNNYDTATTATTTGAAAAADDPTPTPPPTEVSSATVATAPTAEVPSSPSSKEPKGSAAASPPPTSPCRHAGDGVVQESRETLAVKDADSCQQGLREQSPHQAKRPSQSADKDVDNSLQQSQQQLHEQQQQRIPSLSEDNGSTQRQAQGGGSDSQNFEDLPLPYSDEAQDLEKQSPLQSLNEILQTSGDGERNLRESSPLSSENDLPNGGEVAVAHLPIENNRELMPAPPQAPSGNGPVNVNGVVKHLSRSRVDDRVRFKLARATPKNEIKELRKKLKHELDQVRMLVQQLEAKEHQLASYNTQISYSNLSNNSNYFSAEGGNIGGYSHPQPQDARSDMVDRRRAFFRVNSEVGVVGHQESRPMALARVNSDMGAARNLEPRPYSRQLSVAVMVNNHMNGDFVEKEKRTPKANQLYRNSEFLLGKDRLPSESNKRLKTNNGRKHSGDALGFGFRFDKNRNQMFKSCNSLLQRLMKHKYGWVFKDPVDAQELGLVDYHDIIKHPMDLGTIRTRLSQNWYKSPREFAEDVRLVFRNAMTYNPKGQDVHIMAEELLQIFEERWAIIETEYIPPLKYQMYQDSGMVAPSSRKAPPQPHLAPIHGFVPQMRNLDREETMTTPMAVDPKFQRPHVGRTPVPKKPKAKDPDKRDMTYEEKQKLSTHLQSLPHEKLDAIVQIINKRSSALSQHGDEIEVDIDNVDTETLWELDRFVTNYKKSLSKHKRKAELALQARSLANQTSALTNTTPAVAEARIESGTAFEKSAAPPSVEGEKQGYNRSRSISSSSSSSDSGSSSSDSDSDSSSEDGSDAGHSPGT